MNHQIGKKKLNLKSPHRRSLIRNQVIHLIKFGVLQSTRARVKEVQRVAEKIVTISREGWNFNTIRRVKALLPYSPEAVEKMIKNIAPQYVNRPGGYTRVIRLGKRMSDTSEMARLEWVS